MDDVEVEMKEGNAETLPIVKLPYREPRPKPEEPPEDEGRLRRIQEVLAELEVKIAKRRKRLRRGRGRRPSPAPERNQGGSYNNWDFGG